jgi:hypothetical protein
MAKGKKGWFNHSQDVNEQDAVEANSAEEREREYSLEELLELAYLAYRDSADETDLLNRSEFKESIKSDGNRIKDYLSEIQYAAYLKAIGTDESSDVNESGTYIPENNPDSSDEALEILSEGLENSVKEIMKETEPEELESEGMLTPEPDYGAAAEIAMTADESEAVCKPEEENTDEEFLQEEQEPEDKADKIEVTVEEVETNNSDTNKILNARRETFGGEGEKHTDMTDNELEYIFNNKELLAKLRQSVYCAPDDPGMDDELRKMDLDELFEQLLRINGVTRKIPAIIENVHQLYLKRIEDVATEIPRERLEELLLYAIELIRKDNHMEYGDCLNTYLGTQIGMTTEELEKMNVANGEGGYERVTLCVRTNDGDGYYEIEAPYDQAEKVFQKYQMCMADDAYFADPVSFFGCFGIPVLHLDGELDSKATFEEDCICI